ncbi:unnamed protein product [Hyaloperonospora brassicae]|uniref:RxLR effector candidate protein n=1 Tax=Hyaloperonospora brassicae TaxID=162125 RepID=A0AAV0UFS6_HYABA|nr:unnamed protein product [Hyaloperonospora brassicae]
MRVFYLVAPFLGGALPAITDGASGLIEPGATVHGPHELEHKAASRLLRAQTSGSEDQEDRAMNGIRRVGGVLYDFAVQSGFEAELAFIDFMAQLGYDRIEHLSSLAKRTLVTKVRSLLGHFPSSLTDEEKLNENAKVLGILEQEDGEFMTAIVLSMSEKLLGDQYLERVKGVQRKLFDKWWKDWKSPETIRNELYLSPQFIAKVDAELVDAIVANYKAYCSPLGVRKDKTA